MAWWFLGIGGGTNAAFAAAAFRALPFGVPKMLVSTVACGNTRPFIGIKDPPATVPPRFADRSFVSHTPLATLMRTTPAENAEIGAFVARRLNQARGPVGVVIPLRGFSAYDCKGHSFFDPIADAAFVETLTRDLDPRITVERVDAHINDRRCVDVATAMLRGMIGDHHSQERT
jgi:uncharacterized protein (UPF0261 family)